ncbi:MAG: ShlB/FhaC/HecB family hemolysin secretion/activation protein [Rhodocyclaceae bacterium]|nr:ShlB/FhaC/HecB family hemolysin secretion/activation protein [Rhodocyclaceae bacterium]
MSPPRSRLGRAVGLATLCLLPVQPLLAQSGGAGAQLQRYQQEAPAPAARPEGARLPLPPSPSAPAIAASDATVPVKGFDVHGVTQLDAATLNRILSPFTGRALSTADIHAAANALMAHYRAQGFFAAKVFVPPHPVTDGVIRLDVYEGFLAENGIELELRGERVRADVVADILATHLPTTRPMHRADYERALLLAEDLPGATIHSILYPGAEVGTAHLRVRLDNEPGFAGNVDVDNFGNVHTGRVRLGTTLYLNSPTGAGDQLIGRAVASGSDTLYGYLDYLRPVSPRGTRLGANVAHFRYQLDTIAGVDQGEGEATEFRLYATHPLVRSRHHNLHLRASVGRLSVDDRSTGDLDAARTIDLATIGIGGDADHDGWANGLTLFEASLSVGRLSLDGDAAFEAFDRANARTDGRFARGNLMLSRLQHIAGPVSLYGRLTGQWAGKNLDSAQKFYLGGPENNAGYPIGEAAGDEGLALHLEVRHHLEAPPWGGALQSGLFVQQGWIRLHHTPWDGWQGSNPLIENEFSQESVGFSLTQTWPGQWVVRGLIGWQLGDNPLRAPDTDQASDGSDAAYRGWIQAVHYF